MLDNVADWQTLAAGVRAGVEVVVLDSTGDGLAQMATWLAQKTPGSVDAIHLLGHGSSGAVNLGSLTLNTGNLDEHTATLAQIGAALTAEGDWLLYGCNVGAGEQGVAFMGKLAQATGADLAASNNLTGAAALGGDWVLEQTAGGVQTAALAVAGFAQVLPDVILAASTVANSYVGSNVPGFGSSFVATATGTVNKIRVVLYGDDSGGTLKIYSGEGTSGNLLVTQTGINLVGNSSQTNFTYSDIVLTSPVGVNSGQTSDFLIRMRKSTEQME